MTVDAAINRKVFVGDKIEIDGTTWEVEEILYRTVTRPPVPPDVKDDDPIEGLKEVTYRGVRRVIQ